jgi:hypothetical protein
MNNDLATCYHCGSILVCWNWFVIGGSDHWDTAYGHECWTCGQCSETDYEVKNGIPYDAAKALQKAGSDGSKEDYTETMRVLYGKPEIQEGD